MDTGAIMALEKCPECRNDVSSDSKTSPKSESKNSGDPKNAKNAAIGYLFFIIVAVLIFIGIKNLGSPEPINKASDELTLFYINNKIYHPVDCRVKKINEEYYAFLTEAGSSGKIGGLYLIKYDGSKNYQIFTVNGKAAQHAHDKYPQLKNPKDIETILNKF